MASTGYKGPITLEVFSDDYRAAPSTRVALDGRRSVLLLLSEVYDKPQIQGEDVVMEDGVGIQGIAEVLPPVGEVLGFEWTEFVIDEGRVEILGRWLEGLGMRRVAKHKCSKVWLYGNGTSTPLPGFTSHFRTPFKLTMDI